MFPRAGRRRPLSDAWPNPPDIWHSGHYPTRRTAVVVLIRNQEEKHVDAPMTEDLPMAPNTVTGRIRAQVWQEAIAAHRAGRVRVTEVRAS
jgi:hypothetical protein